MLAKEELLKLGLSIPNVNHLQRKSVLNFEQPVSISADVQTVRHIGSYTNVRGGTLKRVDSIGRFCVFAEGVTLGTGEHPTDYLSIHSFQYNKGFGFSFWEEAKQFDSNENKVPRIKGKPHIVVGNDVLIGADVTVMNGVTIGDGAIVETGSVVTEDVEPYSIVGGVPAKHIKYRFTEKIIERLLKIKWWNYTLHSLKGIPFNDIHKALDELDRRKDAGELVEAKPKVIKLLNRELVEIIESEIESIDNPRDGLNYSDKSKNEILELAQKAMSKKDWEQAITYWYAILNDNNVEPSPLVYASLAKALRLSKLYGEAEKVLNDGKEFFSDDPLLTEEHELLKHSYEKIILFDNGETRIEYYKKIKNSNTLCITFDTWPALWNEQPFAFKVLINQDIDIVAVRKRTKMSFHQDLEYNVFLDIIQKLPRDYGRKIAYGSSLGAYNALYYCASYCDVLAMAPRNPAHPIFGVLKDKKVDFKHNLSQFYNPEATPIIYYDSKNKIDNTYVQGDLKLAFPNGRFIECPYAGHTTIRFLHEIGILKSVVLNFIKGEKIPDIDFKLRIQSQQFLYELGQECLNRNKPSWACTLAKSVLERVPDDKNAKLLQIKALRNMGNYREAIRLTKVIIEEYTKDEKLRLLLINIYLLDEDNESAEIELEKAIKDFGNTPKLSRKSNEVSKLVKKKVMK